MDEDLAWRVEEACANACPALRQALVGGWLLRASGRSGMRRTNSVNPLRGGPSDPEAVRVRCESLYAELGQATLFRVPDIAPGMDRSLDAAGYSREGETLTLVAPLDGAPASSRARLYATAGDEWLAARQAFAAADRAAAAAFEMMLDLIVPPVAFAASRTDGRIAAVGYGTVDDGLLVLESIVTDPAQRGRGHGRAVVAGLMRWAAEQRAEAVCLQVQADNAAAHALYAGLGIERCLYRYHYRRAPL